MDEWDHVRKRIKELQDTFLTASVSTLPSPERATVSDFWKKRYDEEKQAWQEKLSTKEQEQLDLRQKFARAEEEIRRLGQTARDLETQLKTVTADRARTRELERELGQGREEWQGKLEALKKENESLRGRLESESGDALKNSEERHRAERERRRAQEDLRTFQETFRALQSETQQKFESLGQEKAALENQIGQLTADLAADREKARGLERELETLRERSSRRLEWLRQRARGPFQILEDLTAGFGQRARSHLHMIAGALKACLEHPRLEGENRESIALVESTARETLALIDQFISMSKIPEVRPQPLDLSRTLAEICLEMERPARERGVSIQNRLQQPLALEADPALTAEALRQLIRNAVEACEPGRQVEIEAGFSKDGESAVVTVANPGEAIPAERMAKIFRPYHTTRKWKRGLGLSIAKLAVELQLGSLAVSNAGGGVLAEISLPIKP